MVETSFDKWERDFQVFVNLIEKMDPKVLQAGGMTLQQLNDSC